MVLGVVYGLGLTVLQAVERATGGWGVGLHFFRVPWIMDGPWYVTWLTSFVLLVLFFLYGMWYGLVYRRWNVVGLVAFIAAQVLVALIAIVAVSTTHNWAAVGHFFTTLTVPALTGVLAALAVALALGGLATSPSDGPARLGRRYHPLEPITKAEWRAFNVRIVMR